MSIAALNTNQFVRKSKELCSCLLPLLRLMYVPAVDAFLTLKNVIDQIQRFLTSISIKHKMSLVTKKTALRVLDQVWYKPNCTYTQDGGRLEISD